MTDWRPRTVSGRIAMLVAISAGLAVISLPIAYGIFGKSGILAVGISCVCCLLPGCVLFVLARHWSKGPALLNLMLAGTMLRAACCVAGAAMMDGALHIRQENYLIWLSLFYMAALAFETSLLAQKEATTVVPGGEQRDKPPDGSADGAGI